ncbi:MAG: hypothetical protein ACLQME_05190 [Alphaproteobacteria bacterium]
MKETEARGLILKRLYDVRDATRSVSFNNFADVKINRIALVNRFALAKLLQQLADQDFISWSCIRTRGGYVDGVAYIKEKGAHAVEHPETVDSSIVFEQSLTNRNLSNAQIASRNVQGVAIDIEPEKPRARTAEQLPVEYAAPESESEGDRVHTLLRALFRLRKHASFVEKLIIAFERSNSEATSAQRRKVFYELLVGILSDL